MLNAKDFIVWRKNRSKKLENDADFKATSQQWLNVAVKNDYCYMFQWFGVPIIQFPSDVLLIQEAIYRSKVNKIIEVGIARGGMTIFLATLLKVIDQNQDSKVIGVDIKLSQHTYEAVKNSPVSDKIILVEGDSTLNSTLNKVRQNLKDSDRVLVILDSNHTHEHVYKELKLYSDIVSKDSFMIVMDTAIAYLDAENLRKDREWSQTNNPKSAIEEFFMSYPRKFVLDEDLNTRSFPGAAYKGFLLKK